MTCPYWYDFVLRRLQPPSWHVLIDMTLCQDEHNHRHDMSLLIWLCVKTSTTTVMTCPYWYDFVLRRLQPPSWHVLIDMTLCQDEHNHRHDMSLLIWLCVKTSTTTVMTCPYWYDFVLRWVQPPSWHVLIDMTLCQDEHNHRHDMSLLIWLCVKTSTTTVMTCPYWYDFVSRRAQPPSWHVLIDMTLC